MKTWYITGSVLRDSFVKVEAETRIEAVASIGLSVCTEEQWDGWLSRRDEFLAKLAALDPPELPKGEPL